MLRRIFNLFSKDLAMDLGTANTLLYTVKDGIVVNEPSVVAIDTDKGTVLAIGKEAKDFLGRTPKHIHAIRPMRDGVIADFEVTSKMIGYFIGKTVRGLNLSKPNIVICVPSGITQVEKRAVIEAAQEAGAVGVHLIEEPMAAAIGANKPIHEPKGTLVVDVGGGTTEVAVISLSAVAYSESVKVGGDTLNQALQRYFFEEFQLLIGENMAERIKMSIGTAFPLPEQLLADISGKDAVGGIPKTIRVSDGHVREALAAPVSVIVATVKKALEKTPPELAADILDYGILLAGGGALLKGLDQLISSETGVKVLVDSAPLTTVVRGTGETLKNKEFYKSIFIN